MYKKTIHLPRGYALTLTAESTITNGYYGRIGQPGDTTSYGRTALAASATVELGPFNDERYYQVDCQNGEIADVQTYAGLIDQDNVNIDGGTIGGADIDAAMTTSLNVGTAATNVTAVERGDGFQHQTILTVTNAVLPAITGGAAEAEGVLLYTLPAGAVVVDKAYMSLAIQQQDGNITADTPDGGLGTTIATGAVATLDGTPAFENIITGQTFNDCDGTAEVKTIAGAELVIEAAGDHTVYFNVADTWAASGDTGALVSGTVVLNWQLMA